MRYLRADLNIFEMQKLILLLGICLAFASGNKLPEHHKTPAKNCGKIVSCFYTTGHPDSKGHVIRIKDIDVSLCTYVYYAVVKTGLDASVDNYDAHAEKYGGVKEFNDLRKRYKDLTLIGRMRNSYGDYTTLLSNLSLRKKLVDNIYKYVNKYGFAGMDIDYSDLGPSNGNPSAKKNFISFMKELKKKFDEKRLILSVSVTPNLESAGILYDMREIAKYVKFVHLKTINFHSNDDFEKPMGIGHFSAMYQSRKENSEIRKRNIDSVVKYYIDKGAPANKLILGTAYTTVSYTLADPKEFRRGARFTKKGKYDGFITHSKLCDLRKKWTYFIDPEQKVPYIHNADQVIAFEDGRSIKVKAKYVQDMHLAGAMVFETGDDDFSGECGQKFPFLKALNEVLRKKC